MGWSQGNRIWLDTCPNQCRFKYFFSKVSNKVSSKVFNQFFILKVQNIVTALLLYIYNRNDKINQQKLIFILLIICCYKPLLTQ